jgi:hypothetical protein
VIIEAFEWTGEMCPEIEEFLRGTNHFRADKDLVIHTLEGDMKASLGDFIIKGVKGELYPCKPDIFWETYEEIKNNE